MVQFHDHVISDLLDSSGESPATAAAGSGLVILSSGLGLAKLVSSLLRSYSHSPSLGTILILSPSTQTLKSQILSAAGERLPEISADVPASRRAELYSSGSALFVTPRILIVDLLVSRLPAHSIAGLVILAAHSVAETSTEAFIVRILRSLNRGVWVRAFSDKPQAMVAGFAKAERTMRCLGIRRLHLWPRFQVYVSEELEREAPEVVDVRVQMSRPMVGIQAAIIEVMDGCLKEMRKTNKVDVEDLTVENGLFKSFDEIVRRQLDPIWHTLGKKTKQLVSDLKTLRKLLDYLVWYDAVTYLKYLDTLRVSESHRSLWIFAESSYKVFEYAKKRVYRFVKSDGTKFSVLSKKPAKRKLKCAVQDDKDKEVEVGASSSANANFTIVLDEVLEEAPKWKVLCEVLEEIQEERQKQGLPEDDSGIVLVACKDERSCMQLEECITNGSKKVMREEWEKYLLNKVQLRDLQTRYKKKPKEPKGFGVLDGVVTVSPMKNAEPSSMNKQEHEALLAAAAEVRNRAKKGGIDKQTDGGTEVDPQAQTVKRNVKRKKLSSPTRRSLRNKDSKNCENAALEGSGLVDEDQRTEADSAVSDKGVLRKHDEAEATGSENMNKPIPPVQFYALESGQPILDTLNPSVIIVYHPDMTFVREIEVHKAENPSKKLKVYFLFYEDSTEVRKFEASIRRENGAFESLIRQKSLMMIPNDQDAHCLGLNSSYDTEISSQNSITRKAGGRREAEKEKQVIVDMREFMSSLPNVLHQKGLKINPVTLEVGDYILSPLICVERKSIQDLYMSFTSGRLYHQVEMMVRYYKIPVLLIEFSQDKSFSFQSASDLGNDVTPYNIISKLSLLALHFPRLRIIWSRSLHATAEIFAALKANQDEPEEAKALRVGVPSEDGIIDNYVRAENYNTSAVEFLRRLPGVTDSNYRALMDGCKSLADLALLPLERLAELMGGQKAARTLREFLDAKYPTLL